MELLDRILNRMISKNKNFLYLLGSITFFLIAIILFFDNYMVKSSNNELTVGVFCDSFWDVQNGNAYKILDNAITKFREDHPNVKIKYETGILKNDYSEWLSQKILNEQTPDLFFILPKDFNQLVEVGALYDLTPLIKEEGPDFENIFYSSAYSFGKYNYDQYALPFECAPKLMFVNQTLLKKENISIPKEDWTWNDFYSISDKVTKDTDGDGSIDQFGFVGYSYMDAFYSNDVHLFSEDGKTCQLNTNNVVESIEFIERLQELNPSTTDKDFDLGNIAFKPMSFSEFRAYQPYPLSLKKYENFEWSCIPMPKGISGKNVSDLECLQIGINSKTCQPRLAWQFLKTLTTDPDIQSQIFTYSEGVSTLKSVTEKDETLGNLIASNNSVLTQEILSQAVDNAVVLPRFTDNTLALLQIDQAINNIIDSDDNIDASLIKWNRSINRSLKSHFVNLEQ